MQFYGYTVGTNNNPVATSYCNGVYGCCLLYTSRTEVEAELARLKRENAVLREERDILKKATEFFVKERR